MRESVAQAMRDALLNGCFEPGEAISEPALAASMNISRGPIREGLLILAEEGVLEYSANRGFSVLRFSQEDVDAILEARLPMEMLALEKARGKLTARDLAKLERVRDRMLDRMRKDDFPGCVKGDLEFHFLLYDLCGNPWLAVALKRIVKPFFIYTMIYRMKPAGLTEELSRKQHTNYIDYLRGNTEMTAGECVQFHLTPRGPASSE
jgi:DNA-binding GntR family transcriptional regulator